MLRPEDTYEVVDTGYSAGEGDPSRVLLYALDGFIDAGAAGKVLVEHLREQLPCRQLALFDTDLLHDYRARRPEVTFADHEFSDWESLTLGIDVLSDDAGMEFLLLHGLEPDVMWDRFTSGVVELAKRFGVGMAVGIQGIPLGVPHTRPLGTTSFATKPELITRSNVWSGQMRLPGSASSLLHLRLSAAGIDALGFAVHVPHYLGDSRYPEAALTAAQAVSSATGLMLPTKKLTDEATVARAMVDEQIANSEELRGVVSTLEERFDADGGADGGPGPGLTMTSGEEISQQVERFLADLDRGQDN